MEALAFNSVASKSLMPQVRSNGGMHWLRRIRASYFGSQTRLSPEPAFTLIELLVVIAIIGILASMLLPVFSRSKETAHMTTCRNNLRQMAITVKLYADDHQNRFPGKYIARVNPTDGLPIGGYWNAQYTMGGPDGKPEWMDEAGEAPPAAYRPFYNYMRPSEVYRCPRDKGMPAGRLNPTNWENLGCSYHYNAGALAWIVGGKPKHPFADQGMDLAEKPEGWVPEPVRHILFYEPPARIYAPIQSLFRPKSSGAIWYEWHLSTTVTEFADPRFARARFISPISFVDGHVARHDFTQRIIEDLRFPYEPTKDWVWYKPGD
jgi:prepilin-type N-terminal cleavage/methylation domain-containing protein